MIGGIAILLRHRFVPDDMRVIERGHERLDRDPSHVVVGGPAESSPPPRELGDSRER